MNKFEDQYAAALDDADALQPLRQQFIIPTRGQLKHTTLEAIGDPIKKPDVEPCTYLCGNSLGLQPRLVQQYTAAYHQTWATKGVYGHFKKIENSPLDTWVNSDEDVMEDMANIVGAHKDEVVVMQTLTANLHFAMVSFYRPTKERYKIIIESKAFPSDHYAIESQIQHHGLNPIEAMVTIEPSSPTTPTLSTAHILSVIDNHASDTAVLLLPAIQFYTGQFFDIATITAHAQSNGIKVGWDLAHAVGNVPVSLHDWNVDFAAWCNYKYMNCGPGSIGGLFIHNRHTHPSSNVATNPSTDASSATDGQAAPLPRLAGWWGSSKSTRFAMTNVFEPIPGAAGWQLSNPSVADLTAVRASLDVFKQTSMSALRNKSIVLTQYLQDLLEILMAKESDEGGLSGGRSFRIITPLNAEARGAQLSLRLAPGLLDGVMEVLEENGVVVDERRPDVIRVAPAPLYNNAKDVLRFVRVFAEACQKARSGGTKGGGVMVDGGKEGKGWSEIK
ncbi:Kynureninase [Sphaceloma murrayae]|uniref:Kynureninase n=1 Tax=Sphaceloma murrayae TaxID=2082308 RepID=A0A2K1QPV8_9PEZI|nr:Kynureninase [Sphaceloma murrayae]